MPETSAVTTILAIKAAMFTSILTFLTYVGIPHEPFFILWALMLVDMVTWVSKQYRLNRQEITSHRAWLGLIKKVYVLVWLLSVWLAIKWYWYTAEWFLKWVLTWFLTAELYSVIQNIYIFSTWVKVTEFNATSFVFRTILSVIKKTLELWAKKFLNDSSTWNSQEQSKSSRNEASSKQSEQTFGG